MSTLIAPERAPRTGGLESPPTRARESFLASNARTLLAASGFVMLGFVVVHLAGNLLTFAGAAPFNAYARWLREVGSPLMPESGLLWVARVVLAGALAAHLASHLYLMTHPDALSGPALGPFDPMPPWYATLPVGVFQVSGADRRVRGIPPGPAHDRGHSSRLYRGWSVRRDSRRAAVLACIGCIHRRCHGGGDACSAWHVDRLTLARPDSTPHRGPGEHTVARRRTGADVWAVGRAARGPTGRAQMTTDACPRT